MTSDLNVFMSLKIDVNLKIKGTFAWYEMSVCF